MPIVCHYKEIILSLVLDEGKRQMANKMLTYPLFSAKDRYDFQ